MNKKKFIGNMLFLNKKYIHFLYIFLLILIPTILYYPRVDTFLFAEEPNHLINHYLSLKEYDGKFFKYSYEAGKESIRASGKGSVFNLRPIPFFIYDMSFYFLRFDIFYYKIMMLVIYITMGILLYILLNNFSSIKYKNSQSTFSFLVVLFWLIYPPNTRTAYEFFGFERSMGYLLLFASLIFLVLYFKKQHLNHHKKYDNIFFILSFVILLISLLFKEDNIINLPVFLFAFYILKKEYKIMKIVRFQKIILAIILITMILFPIFLVKTSNRDSIVIDKGIGQLVVLPKFILGYLKISTIPLVTTVLNLGGENKYDPIYQWHNMPLVSIIKKDELKTGAIGYNNIKIIDIMSIILGTIIFILMIFLLIFGNIKDKLVMFILFLSLLFFSFPIEGFKPYFLYGSPRYMLMMFLGVVYLLFRGLFKLSSYIKNSYVSKSIFILIIIVLSISFAIQINATKIRMDEETAVPELYKAYKDNKLSSGSVVYLECNRPYGSIYPYPSAIFLTNSPIFKDLNIKFKCMNDFILSDNTFLYDFNRRYLISAEELSIKIKNKQKINDSIFIYIEDCFHIPESLVKHSLRSNTDVSCISNFALDFKTGKLTIEDLNLNVYLIKFANYENGIMISKYSNEKDALLNILFKGVKENMTELNLSAKSFSYKNEKIILNEELNKTLDENDTNICTTYSEQLKEECEKAYAIKNKDLNRCYFAGGLKDECIRDYALINRKPDRCNFAGTLKEECYKDYAIISKDESYCDSRAGKFQEICQKEFAIIHNQQYRCDSAGSLREECLKDYALVYGLG